MPLMRCKMPDGRVGWKWGKDGKCYYYKSEALEQGRAIEANKHKKEKDDE